MLGKVLQVRLDSESDDNALRCAESTLSNPYEQFELPQNRPNLVQESRKMTFCCTM